MKDTQLIRFAKAFRDGILDGERSDSYCWMVSAPLSGLLHAHGVNAELRETKHVRTPEGSTCHFWLQLGDGRVLDPTVDQFDPTLPPVYLGKKIRRYHRARASPMTTQHYARKEM